MIEAVLVLSCYCNKGGSTSQLLKLIKPFDNLLIDVLSGDLADIVSTLLLIKKGQELNEFEAHAYQSYLSCEKRIWGEMD